MSRDTAAGDVMEIGTRLELFAAPDFIDTLSGDARLELHRPVPQEVSMVCDRPWEGNSSGYFTVFRDGPIYRMYYRGSQQNFDGWDVVADHREVACYALSTDGIHWTRPELGLHEFDGSTANNIVVDSVGVHNFTPFMDTNPECPDDARYKAIARDNDRGGLVVFKSADGLHWELIQQSPVITDGAFDSQNLAFWDSVRGQYRAYWRDFKYSDAPDDDPDRPRERDIKTGTSNDFINWTEGQWLQYTPGRRGTDDDTPPPHQLYTNAVRPYYRAPHIFVGFPTRYIDHGWTPSTDELPGLEHRRTRSEKNMREGSAITDTLFMTGRDAQEFFVWPRAFVPPGIQRHGSWNYGDNYLAWGMVETPSPLPGAPNDLSLYVTEAGKLPGPRRLRRYTLRVDGFASASASLKGGEVITKPLVFEGKELQINFATSAGGSVRVELQDADGAPIEGFTLDDSVEMYGDELARAVQWGETTDVSKLAGKPVRLRFALRDADVYAMQFVE